MVWCIIQDMLLERKKYLQSYSGWTWSRDFLADVNSKVDEGGESEGGECSEGSVPRLGSGVPHFYNRPLVNHGSRSFNLISREIEKCIILVCSGRGNEIPKHLVNLCHKDFPGSPMIKTLPSKIPNASGPKKNTQNIKQKQYCNKFNT